MSASSIVTVPDLEILPFESDLWLDQGINSKNTQKGHISVRVKRQGNGGKQLKFVLENSAGDVVHESSTIGIAAGSANGSSPIDIFWFRDVSSSLGHQGGGQTFTGSCHNGDPWCTPGGNYGAPWVEVLKGIDDLVTRLAVIGADALHVYKDPDFYKDSENLFREIVREWDRGVDGVFNSMRPGSLRHVICATDTDSGGHNQPYEPYPGGFDTDGKLRLTNIMTNDIQGDLWMFAVPGGESYDAFTPRGGVDAENTGYRGALKELYGTSGSSSVSSSFSHISADISTIVDNVINLSPETHEYIFPDMNDSETYTAKVQILNALGTLVEQEVSYPITTGDRTPPTFTGCVEISKELNPAGIRFEETQAILPQNELQEFDTAFNVVNKVCT